MDLAIQIIGWVGTALIVGAYYAVSRKIYDGQSRVYQLMNLFGSLGLLVNVLYRQAWPSVGLQIIWALIALYALWQIQKS